MDILFNPVRLLLATARDVIPVLGLLLVFQIFVLKRPIPRPGRIIFGFCLVLVGLACFLGGLDLALFPIGRAMALQLAEDAQNSGGPIWISYGWIYLFAFLVGFSTTIAEPSLIAVANKAAEASRNAISPWGLRVAVALQSNLQDFCDLTDQSILQSQCGLNYQDLLFLIFFYGHLQSF